MSNLNEKNQTQKEEIKKDQKRVAVALSTTETVKRYGSANAEFIKGYTGVDHEAGKKLAQGLKGISQGNVHPDYVEQNLKQQAGYSAEVAATSRDNAEAIIKNSNVRSARSDDLPQYGRNHNVVDRVRVLDGEIIKGSESQMKVVGNPKQLLNDIAKPDGKFSRYRGVKLELPSEQYEEAIEHCKKKAKELRVNSLHQKQVGDPEIAKRLEEQAKNYEELAENIVDLGLSTEDALAYRTRPLVETAKDITRTSHRAGIEGAKYGSVIGGVISLITNSYSVAQEKKQISEAVQDVAIDTVKASALGYSTAFTGSALKGGLQQSSKQSLRTLANTNAPALAVSVCVSLGGSVKRYVSGDITEAQLLSEVGEKGAGMLSSGMMAGLGQLAIPIPVVGAVVGGMIGYTLSSFFYQSALEAARDVEFSRADLERVKAIEFAARARVREEQAYLDAFIATEIPQLRKETEQLLSVVSGCAGNVNAVAEAINKYALLVGKELQFESLEEFDDFMSSDKPFVF